MKVANIILAKQTSWKAIKITLSEIVQAESKDNQPIIDDWLIPRRMVNILKCKGF